MIDFFLKINKQCLSLFLKLKFSVLFSKKIKFSKAFFGNRFIITIGKFGYLELGKGFSCRNNLSINVDSGKTIIGQNVFFNDNCSVNCIENIVIGDECIFGQNVMLFDHDHKFRSTGIISQMGMNSTSIILGKNIWIGAGVIILRGSTIGDNCVIGANTVVKGKIPPNSIVYQERKMIIKEIMKETNIE